MNKVTELTRTIESQIELIIRDNKKCKEYLTKQNNVVDNLWNGDLLKLLNSLLYKFAYILSVAEKQSLKSITIYDYLYIEEFKSLLDEVLRNLKSSCGHDEIVSGLIYANEETEDYIRACCSDTVEDICDDFENSKAKYEFIYRINKISNMKELKELMKDFNELKEDVCIKVYSIITDSIDKMTKRAEAFLESLSATDEQIRMVESGARIYIEQYIDAEYDLLKQFMSNKIIDLNNKKCIVELRDQFLNLDTQYGHKTRRTLLWYMELQYGSPEERKNFFDAYYQYWRVEKLFDFTLFIKGFPEFIKNNGIIHIDIFYDLILRHNLFYCFFDKKLNRSFEEWLYQKEISNDAEVTEVLKNNNAENSVVPVAVSNVMEKDIMDYVSVLAGSFNGTQRQHETLWGKIIQEGTKTNYTTGRGKTISLFEKNHNKGRTFNQRVVHFCIGELIKSKKYLNDASSIAILLGDCPYKRTIYHDILKGLDISKFDQISSKKLTDLLK